jgi:uncharacterized protein (DUF885 family)
VIQTAHETWPGHYLQFLHLAQARSLPQKLITSMLFIEGWAHYAETLIVEMGYENHNLHHDLYQTHMALVRDCRFLITLRQYLGEDIRSATEYFTQQTSYPLLRARQEVQRSRRDMSCLLYTPGRLLFQQLRSRLHQWYPSLSLRVIHDTLLGFGAPPLSLLKDALEPQKEMAETNIDSAKDWTIPKISYSDFLPHP